MVSEENYSRLGVNSFNINAGRQKSKNAFITPQLSKGGKLSRRKASAASNPFQELDILSLSSLQNSGLRSSQLNLPPLQNKVLKNQVSFQRLYQNSSRAIQVGGGEIDSTATTSNMSVR